MSIILVEINTTTKVSKIIEKEVLTEDQICETIASYFGFSISELTSKKDDLEHRMFRQFISYFLSTELGIIPKEIASILNYSDTSMIGYNFKIIQREITKPIDPEKPNRYLRVYNNLYRLLTRYKGLSRY